ncbi:filamentous hemagglutinin family N-terminal domain [Thioploca ingrica]|uniref:Filamentous hemagglutinin family N-terminal domain n=1 Tax=Thioploca ingrica TaxID=40754 RepID=A0A090AHE2_9GAMM|nr:filamentous hemagglutinin family N-terminal domain [Thioploca ingrica]
MPNRIRWLAWGIGLGLLLLKTSSLLAEVVLDGTLGPATTLPGPRFDITADLGQQQGGNLFHSFKFFNLNKEETATFSGPSTVENIIGRITGGERSIIDGKIEADIPQADLYLINPDGFIFGPHTQLDLPGALHISTATQLYLGQAGIVETRQLAQSLLVSAPPSAFGFLDPIPGSIEVKESELVTRTGKSLSLLGGDITIDGGHLRAISGRINLAAVNSANQITTTPHDLVVNTQEQLGKITLANDAAIDVGKQGAGDIYIRGGQFEIDNSAIIANTEADQNGGIIAIKANELHLNNRSSIDSRVFGPGKGGQIAIEVDGKATLSGDSTIVTSSLGTKPQSGNAGDVTLKVQYLDLENSSISTTTFGPGQGGNITIEASDNISLTSTTDSSAAIQASSEGNQEQAGNAGRIAIKAKEFNLSGANSKVDNSTSGSGQGGSIHLQMGNTLRICDDAFISADSKGTGNAGNIYISTNALAIDQGRISTAADRAKGGNIVIGAHNRVEVNHGQISATVSAGQGKGGNLAIGSPSLFRLQDSKIIANASAGDGGLVLIIAATPMELMGSSITASSETGLDGDVKIDNIYSVDPSTLPVEFLDASNLIKQQCANRSDTQLSRFTLTGRGGLPNAPDDLQTYLPTY